MTSQEIFDRILERQLFHKKDVHSVRGHPHEVVTWLTMAKMDLEDAICYVGFRHPSRRDSFESIFDALAELFSCLEQHGNLLKESK